MSINDLTAFNISQAQVMQAKKYDLKHKVTLLSLVTSQCNSMTELLRGKRTGLQIDAWDFTQ